MSASKEGKDKKVKILGVENISPPKDKQRPATRMKLLNDVGAAGDPETSPTTTTSSSKTPPSKQEKRGSVTGSRIKILNDEILANPKGEKRGAPKTPTPTSSTVKILNEKRVPSATVTALETAKIKTSPNKRKKMEHYVLQAVKTENSKADTTVTVATEEDEETIAYILADDEEVVPGRIEDTNGQEIVVTEEEDDDKEEGDEDGDGEGNSSHGTKIKEIVEHVCGKCYKTFRRVQSLKKHLEFCRYDSGYHLRKADMLKNLEKIEKDAVVMEKKDICFCCSESYDTFHVSLKDCCVLQVELNLIFRFSWATSTVPTAPNRLRRRPAMSVTSSSPTPSSATFLAPSATPICAVRPCWRSTRSSTSRVASRMPARSAARTLRAPTT